jgi:hypothetical protein
MSRSSRGSTVFLLAFSVRYRCRARSARKAMLGSTSTPRRIAALATG